MLTTLSNTPTAYRIADGSQFHLADTFEEVCQERAAAK
jgi:hypothetical protein